MFTLFFTLCKLTNSFVSLYYSNVNSTCYLVFLLDLLYFIIITPLIHLRYFICAAWLLSKKVDIFIYFHLSLNFVLDYKKYDFLFIYLFIAGYAWVTLATNDSYSLGALVLANSLKQVGTQHQLAVLITPGVTGAMR